MNLYNICLRVSTMLIGGALIVTQVFLNWEYLSKPTLLSGLGLAVIVVPFATAVAVVVMDHARVERRYGFAAVAFFTILCGVAHTFSIALERGVQSRESGIAARASINVDHDLAKKSHAAALVRVTEMEVAEAKACRTTGKACTAARASLGEARTWAETKQGELAQVGVPISTTGMVDRYGPVANVLDVWMPVFLPMAIELGGFALLGFAFRRERDPQVQASAMFRPVSKVDDAIVEIQRLREENNGVLPPVREVARRIGHSTTTTHRALKSVA